MTQFWPRALLLLAAAIVALPAGALADQSAQPGAPAAGQITAGSEHSCAVVPAGARCWGYGGDRRLGYGTTDSIGDDETPGSVGPLDFGPGLTATAISAGGGHTCALLSDQTVRCWGYGGDGRRGYMSVASSPAGQSPGAAGAVNVGGPVKAISAGRSHTCALLVDGTVRCWGYGGVGQLGYSKPNPTGTVDPPSVGDDETPASAGPVNLGRPATAISAGGAHTCALLDDGTVRCWGFGGYGALGYADGATIGDNETPNTVGPVFLGINPQSGLPNKATSVSAGTYNTCVRIEDGTARCWGDNLYGQLGLGNKTSVGQTQRPGDVAPIDLGGPVRAIVAGDTHTCAVMLDGALRCWGDGQLGQVGSGSPANIGDDELPTSIPPVALGPGRTAVAVDAGDFHTCALLDDSSVRCWGWGSAGRTGYCNQYIIGDDELPTVLPAVPLDAGAACPVITAPAGGSATPVPLKTQVPDTVGDAPSTSNPPVDPLAAEAARRLGLRTCLRTAARRAKAARPAARRTCLRRYGRTPGKVTRLRARATARTRVTLTFDAPGSDGRNEPAARGYLVRQSLRPLRTSSDVSRAPALCRSTCRFMPTAVGTRMTLAVTGLQPATTYYYVVAARDNVSNRLGPRSAIVRVRTPPAAPRG